MHNSIIPDVAKVKAQITQVKAEVKLYRAQLKLVQGAKSANLKHLTGDANEKQIEVRIAELEEQGKFLRRQLKLSEEYRAEIDSRKESTPSAGEKLAVGA